MELVVYNQENLTVKDQEGNILFQWKSSRRNTAENNGKSVAGLYMGESSCNSSKR